MSNRYLSDCPGLRVGRNAEKRVEYESVVLLVKP